jgi:hypothetical protein
MTGLVDAYQRREVHVAEKILRGVIYSLCSTTTMFTLLFRQPLDNHGRQLHSAVYRRVVEESANAISH